MATKFAKYRCYFCQKKKVVWKLITIGTEVKQVRCCFPCGQIIKTKLLTFNTREKPNKKEMMKRYKFGEREIPDRDPYRFNDKF